MLTFAVSHCTMCTFNSKVRHPHRTSQTNITHTTAHPNHTMHTRKMCVTRMSHACHNHARCMQWDARISQAHPCMSQTYPKHVTIQRRRCGPCRRSISMYCSTTDTTSHKCACPVGRTHRGVRLWSCKTACQTMLCARAGMIKPRFGNYCIRYLTPL